MMKLVHNCTCAYCNMPLKWWNAQTCTKCHRTICSHHAAITRYTQKSVLQAVCTCCTEQRINVPPMSVVPPSPRELVTV
jgi:hypothetical protein